MTIRGTYENGTIRLDEAPSGVARARVEVRFIEEPSNTEDEAPRLRFGMFRKDGKNLSTVEDFEEAKRSLHSREFRDKWIAPKSSAV